MARRYDVVIIHPPSMTHFWEKPILPGPIHRTVSIYTPLFIMFPIGMISIASYLEEKGIKVKVVNLAEMLLLDRNFDFHAYIKSLQSDIYAIGLHWVVHVHGAIEIARICKEVHPDSTVLLGGLTATCFAEEIVRDFDFIDCVVRGEGEYPLYILINNLKKSDNHKAFSCSPNITYKSPENKIVSTPMENPFIDLDSLNFTRLDLVEPHSRTITSPINGLKMWNLPFYRGCGFNCATCGGSKTSYSQLLSRNKFATRSPEKLLEDFIELDYMGINSIFLFMDPRLCGQFYLDRFFKLFKNSKWSNIRNVGIECFFPASKTYFEKWKQLKIADNIGFSISPESASEKVRMIHGRHYTTDQLIKTIIAAKELNLPIGVFFLLVLGHESVDTLNEMLFLWKKILGLNNSLKNIDVDFSPMIFLDPCSPAFFNPSLYGYKLRHKTLKEYYNAVKLYPHWSMWLSYETKNFTQKDIVRIILEMWEKLENIKYQLNLISKETLELEILLANFEKSVFKNLRQINSNDLKVLEDFARDVLNISKDIDLVKKFIAESTDDESFLTYSVL